MLPLEHKGEPWIMFVVSPAVAALRRCTLVEGVVLVAREVPCRLSEKRLAATRSVGVEGAMYTRADISLMTLPQVLPSTRRLF
jgi:hypothetical protein